MPFPAHSLPKCPSEELSGESSGRFASDARHHKRPARRCKDFFGGQQAAVSKTTDFSHEKPDILTRITRIFANYS
jgi:hypothetical protein